MTIKVAGRVLTEEEEIILRNDLLDGEHVPNPFEADGCSGGCPDTWPLTVPPEQRLPLYLACVVHDASPPWDDQPHGRIAAALLAARSDATLLLNWWMLGELYHDRVRQWGWVHRTTWRAHVMGLYAALRVTGWIAWRP